jgi:glycosyltransferase involved in cell wall biosynthesis
MARLHILVLANVPPGAVGGAEVQALLLSQRWAHAGHFVTVMGYANVPVDEQRLRILRIPMLKRFRIVRGVSYLAATLFMLWTRRQQFDVVYCRFMKEQAVAAAIARALFGLRQPIVACPANSEVGGDVAYLRSIWPRWIWRLLLNRHIACINATTRRIRAEVESLQLSGPSIASIPNGVVVPESTSVKELEDGTLRAIYVGRLVPQKGVDVLLRALSAVLEQGQHLLLEIVGDGPQRSNLEAMVDELGLGPNVTFVGKLLPGQVPARLARADLFVLPSRFEGMAGSLLEAFSQGLPAVATRVSGSEDIIDDETGWLVAPSDAEALADALVAACKRGRPGLQAMGRRAVTKARRSYHIDTVANQYEDLFHNLVLTGKQYS